MGVGFRFRTQVKDLEWIDLLPRIAPWRWPDYLLDQDIHLDISFASWRRVQDVIPFCLIDKRIMDLATQFCSGPEDNTLRGYRRLEDIVRERSNVEEHGAKLFSKALSQTSGFLTWPELQPTEIAGRVELFTGTYNAAQLFAQREKGGYTVSGTQLCRFLKPKTCLRHC